METKFLYLLVDFFVIIVCFIFSFHPKLKFHKQWPSFMGATFLVGLFFILWDIQFTKMGVWSFNPSYLTGIYLFNLPIEEYLFFFCIPYACVFTYHAFNIFLGDRLKNNSAGIYISYALILLTISVASIFYSKWYTFVTALVLACLLLFLLYKKTSFLTLFYLVYSVIFIPFLLSNGILTGGFTKEAVVMYNNQENLGIRIFTIPIEDVFYGMILLLSNISLFEYLRNRYKKI
jgi:lycopene cyclase domain-containing protein